MKKQFKKPIQNTILAITVIAFMVTVSDHENTFPLLMGQIVALIITLSGSLALIKWGNFDSWKEEK